MRSVEFPLLPLVLAPTAPDVLRAMLDQEGVAWMHHMPGTPQGKFVVCDSRQPPLPKLLPNQQAIDLADVEPIDGLDPWHALNELSTHRAVWRVGNHEVAEEIARHDRRRIRQHCLNQLRQAVERAGGAWLRTAPVPFPYRSAFCLRLDHDDYIAEDFAATLDALQGAEDLASHFVCAAPFEQHPEAVARLRGCDVGSHGYRHHTYADLPSNVRNIRQGIETLQALGLEPYGFVAPMGRYNLALEQTLLELDIPYSSEFGLAYDDWPFRRVDGRLLQIPVHPVSLGICLEALGSRGQPQPNLAHNMVAAWLEHCCRLIDQRNQAGELTIVYCHPDGRLGRYPQVIRDLVAHARSQASIWRTTMGNLERWWRARSSVRYRVYRHGAQFVIAVDEQPTGWPMGVEYWRGQHVAVMPLDRPLVRFAPSALAYQNRKATHDIQPVRIDRHHSLRHRLKRYLDWEYVTPTDQIEAGHFRGWLKRTLRRLRSS